MEAKNRNSISRRHFLALGSSCLTMPFFTGWLGKVEGPSAQWRISAKGKEIGLKVTQDSRGHLMLSARELRGKKLFLIPLGKPGKQTEGNSYTSEIKLKDGSRMSLRIDKAGRISANMKGAKFGPMDYRPGNDNENSAQGFWSWIGDKVNDIASGIAATWLYMRGQIGEFDTSNGGYIVMDGDTGSIDYQGGGFKLEPGMEEEGNVWY